MADFCDVLGQERIKAQLQKAAESGQLSNAYLFLAEEGMGGETLARAFGQKILCHEKTGCHRCHSCIQMEAGSHGDFLVLQHEKPQLISVQEVREQLCSEALIRPLYGDRRVLLVPEAEKMNVSAQNALLKTLEEGPDYMVFLLICSNEAALLETVLSRLIKYRLRPVKREVMEPFLREEAKKRNLSLREEELSFALAYGRGVAERAGEAAFSEERKKELREGLSLFLALCLGTEESFRACLRFSEAHFQNRAQDFLDFAALFLRDLMAARCGGTLLFSAEERALRQLGRELSPRRLGESLDLLEESRRRLRANVNRELTIQLFLDSIRGLGSP